MATNQLKVSVVSETNLIQLAPTDPFKSARLNAEQVDDLIAALQEALETIRKTPFTRYVNFYNWHLP